MCIWFHMLHAVHMHVFSHMWVNRRNSIDHTDDPLAPYMREDKMRIIQGTYVESINDEHNAFPETTANGVRTGGESFLAFSTNTRYHLNI